jgi:hypothetical protein
VNLKMTNFSHFYMGSVLLIILFAACQKELERKEQQSVTLDIPKPPTHVSQYVTLAFTLHCGTEKYSDFQETSGKIAFKNTKDLSSTAKCYVAARGNPTNFKKQHQDVVFKQEQSADSAVFYMSPELLVKGGQTAAVLYPTFELGSQSQTLVKVKAKLQDKDGRSPSKNGEAKSWLVECEGTKSHYLMKTQLDGESWNLEVQFLKSEIPAQGSGSCQISSSIDSQYYVAEKTTLVKADKNPAASPVEITLKAGDKPTSTPTSSTSNSGQITIDATID